MQNKLPLEYGPREAEILRSLTEAQKLPSKNEGFRRGLVAVDYLMDADRRLLLEVLANSLSQARESIRDTMDSFQEKLEICKMLASEIVATFAVQKGIQSADAVDVFRADLDNYLVLVKTKTLRAADKDKIADRLSFLSQMAREFAKRERAESDKAATSLLERGVNLGGIKYKRRDELHER